MRRGGFLIVLLVVAFATTPARAADPLRFHQWGMTMVHADEAHAVTTGEGATVAVIDTGAYFAHPDLQGRLIAGRDFVEDDDTPQDQEGHGTHVAGIVAANADNGIGVDSVAPGAKVLVVRVLNADGEGTAEDVDAGIDWAVAHGADVINLSLGPDTPLIGGSDPEFDAALGRALDRGVIVVGAAGNSGLPACDQPSATGRLLCVGAVDRDENKAFYSNFGDGLAISAPGGAAFGSEEDDIFSTYVPHSLLNPITGENEDRGVYEWLAGTSQATPHVSGVAALLVSLGVRGQAAVKRILATARDVGPAGPDSVYGAGILDARAAVAGLSRPGGGGGGGGSSGGSAGRGVGSAARISLARVLKLRTALRQGIRVRCTATGAGRCRVSVYLGGRLIASASRAVRPGVAATVTARLNARGRARARAELRRRHPRVLRWRWCRRGRVRDELRRAGGRVGAIPSALRSIFRGG
jgi:subtilisin family serine protease